MTTAGQKSLLRKIYLAQRRALTSDEVHARSGRIMDRIQCLPTFATAATVLTYLSHDQEVDTWPLVRRLLEEGRPVAVPYMNSPQEMFWSVLEDMETLKRGKYGIYEPGTPAPLLPPKGAICIVPAIAWSTTRYRLGYGGGHFDRFLSSFAGISIGLAYQFQVVDLLPLEPHDQPVDLLLTESQSY